jgi:cytochrome c oxidase assembly protein subunit 15
MFLYPLAKMTGGVFYEHAHRLLGTLVGATTLALAVYLSLQRGRRGLSQFSSACPHGQAENGTVPFNGTVRLAAGLFWTAGACVLVQGILGGFRVTENSPALAVVHGFFAHVVLGLLVAAAVLLSDGRSGLRGGGPVAAWKVSGTLRVPSVEAEEGIADGTRSVPDTLPHRAAGPDLLLTGLLIGVVLLQTLLGTLVRQRDVTFMAHVAVAAVVAAVSLSAGMRAWGRHGDVPLLRRGGIALVLLVVLQIGLGIVSAAMRTPPVEQSPSAAVLAQGGGLRPALPALLTTAHQTTAALILAVGVLLGVGTGSRE